MKKHQGQNPPDRSRETRPTATPASFSEPAPSAPSAQTTAPIAPATPAVTGLATQNPPFVTIPDVAPASSARLSHKPVERPQKIWRHEEKYLLDEVAFTQLYWRLRPFVQLDRHASLPGWPDDPATFDAIPGLPTDAQYPGYQVKSLYFDTIGRHGLFEKLAGVDQRFKYRIRVYNNGDQVIHLEKKMKRNQYCLKSSIPVTRPQVEALLAGDAEWLLDVGQLGVDMYTEIRTRLLKPLVLVDYHRIPLTWPADEIRITFDSHLSTGIFRTDLFDPNAALHPALPHGQVILEVKYNHFMPDFLNALLDTAGAMPVSMSKYAMCCREISFSTWSDPQDTLDD